ncbi:GIY-YIG nuclease family protein [Nesterenkonia sp. MY13]|uniref:GIY-YIG nuclease family protein n=1 Tax=Nesterenkonia sedimenti TaxID=1463632 RepID=A0A7X8YD70_9MICC|nr:GIY-YIG nuclease family protein [Nesterenkonia sedimenti]NLS09145.1 GIY-YIG nuclease family protein [Nesterenkonia sedimenti]
MAGKQVRLFLVDGTAGGLMTAEIMNWTGHLLMGKRAELSRIKRRPEARRTGVYILLGEHPKTGGKLAYIGQSDDVAKRLANHDAKKDFWTDVAIITSKDTNLTSAHVRFIESQLIQLAQTIGRIPLENGNSPSGGADLPEADESDMNYFIEQVKIVLPVLGVDIFRGRTTQGPRTSESALRPIEVVPDSPVFHLDRPKLGVQAKAQVIDGEFTMLRGSRIRSTMRQQREKLSPSTQSAFDLRQATLKQLNEDGSLSPAGELGELTRDVVFTSPSAAGATALGQASLNGRTDWTSSDGKTFDHWENPPDSDPLSTVR